MNPPPAKRARPSEESQDQPSALHPNLQPDEEFWVVDSDSEKTVVLVCRNVKFRVSQELLASASSVLSEQLSSITSDDTAEDGCVSVRLSDSPEDMRHFLRALTSKTQEGPYISRPPASYHQISAVVRLAHKYDVAGMLQEGIDILKEGFPSRFDVWLKSKLLFRKDDRCAISAINLARLTNTPIILPYAFYQCMTYGVGVFEGWRREDGTVEDLNPNDLRRYLNGRNMVDRWAFFFLRKIFDNKLNICYTLGKCDTQLYALQQKALKYRQDDHTRLLRPWGKFFNSSYEEMHALCEHCVKGLTERELELQKFFWDSLPGIFKVELAEWNANET